MRKYRLWAVNPTECLTLILPGQFFECQNEICYRHTSMCLAPAKNKFDLHVQTCRSFLDTYRFVVYLKNRFSQRQFKAVANNTVQAGSCKTPHIVSATKERKPHPIATRSLLWFLFHTNSIYQQRRGEHTVARVFV